jgi:hypothetical protein
VSPALCFLVQFAQEPAPQINGHSVGFGFEAAELPIGGTVPIFFAGESLDDPEISGRHSVAGSINGVVVVPEPSMLVFLSISLGLLFLAGSGHLRRSHDRCETLRLSDSSQLCRTAMTELVLEEN